MSAPTEDVNMEVASPMNAVAEETSEREAHVNYTADEGSAKSDCGEAPAVEGLLLLQHVAGDAPSLSRPPKRQSSPDESAVRSFKTVDPEIDCTTVNPIHTLLKKEAMMRLRPEVELKGRFRGVFVLPEQHVYYSVIRIANEFHFLGFHHSAAAAAQAWDLAALKRAMDTAENLSTANTNFRLEDYVRLENVLSMMVVLRFEELVEMFRDVHDDLGSADDLKEVQNIIETCKTSFEDELGNVSLPVQDNGNSAIIKTQSLTADEMRDVISSTAAQTTSQNRWVKNIRDSKKWKGVYFSRDGVPYSKVEFGGKYHYLGRFDTLEGAARAYDLATLKRAMTNHQPIVSLNFPKDDYIKDKHLLEFLYAADSEQVSRFIRKTAQNQKAYSMGDHYGRGRTPSKRQKLDGASMIAAFSSPLKAPAESSLQHIDWDALGFGKDKALKLELVCRHHQCEQSGEGGGRNFGEMDEMVTDPAKKPERKVERRICDANMANLLRESKDWNMSACQVTTFLFEAGGSRDVSGDVAEWFGAFTSEVEGRHAVELTNACGQQSFHFICYVAKDHCRFSATAWNQFVDEIGLAVGDILVLLKSDALWKLSYAVFVLPDALMTDAFAQNVQYGATQKLSKAPTPMYIPPPTAIRPSAAPAPTPPPARTLHANVMQSAQNLSNIQILHKIKDGRLLVEAGFIRDPTTGYIADQTKRNLFVIPASALSAAAMIRPPSGLVGFPGQPFSVPSNKRVTYSNNPNPKRLHLGSSRMQKMAHPACLPSAPIRLNLRGGISSLAKKADANLFMVTDANGQVRLLTSQPPSHSVGRGSVTLQPVNYSHPAETEPAVGYPSHFFTNEAHRNPRSSALDRVSHTSPEVTVIDPSTTGSDASGSGTEKPLNNPAQQEEHSSQQKQIIDLVGEEEKEAETEKQGDSLPDMYTRIMKIIEDCQGLDADVAKKYKFSYVNKMTQGQQIANFMELKNLSEAGEWTEVAEWIKSTVENLA